MMDINSSLCFAASYFAVSHFGGVPPRIKIHLVNHSIDKSVGIFRQFEQVFSSNRTILNEMKENGSYLDSVSAEKIYILLIILKRCLGGGGEPLIICGFALLVGSLGT
jgi:hypothetical protein